MSKDLIKCKQKVGKIAIHQGGKEEWGEMIFKMGTRF
jgi:catabolite regulation protein CreA